MPTGKILKLIAFSLLACGTAASQTTASNIVGTLTDAADAVVPNMEVHLTDQATGAARTVTTTSVGIFRFNNVPPAVYSITVKATGFKAFNLRDISLSSNETRDLGRLTLQVGSVIEEVSVTAQATPVQTASSEKAATVLTGQIEALPTRGRNVYDFVAIMPGVVGGGGRDVNDSRGVGGITINGSTSLKNVTLDGMTNQDVGCGDCLTQGSPNMDAIAEVRVLSSNYQAEFGRNAGGTITVVTKGGTTEYRGSAWWTHRHEQFNANQWENNRSSASRSKYRYNVFGWSLGGPLSVPWKPRPGVQKLFFFGSQEFTKQVPSATLTSRQMPTALERQGNFSQSFNVDGSLIVVRDPATGLPYPGNAITSALDPVGQKIVNFLPQPNYSPGPGSADYRRYNYLETLVGRSPLRNDVARIDVNISTKLTGFFRYVYDANYAKQYTGTGHTFDSYYVGNDYYADGYAWGGSVIYTVNPSMVNQFGFGRSGSEWAFYMDEPAKVARSLWGNVPQLYPHEWNTGPKNNKDGKHSYNYLPNVGFGGTPVNATSIGLGRECPNPVYTYGISDDLSKIWGSHNLKFGINYDYAWKYQPSNQNVRGAFNFGVSADNPLNTGHGYANALLGVFQSYTETTDRKTNLVTFSNIEWYAQDNWRVTRRLTLDYGIRFYTQTPQVDQLGSWAIFDPGQYSRAKAPRQYVPGCSGSFTGSCASARRIAVDPSTGATAPLAAVGLFVPGSGEYANGMIPIEKGEAAYHQKPVVTAGPRVGFAYDVFGTGKTAIRGGYGLFYNRVSGNSVYNMTGNPPRVYTGNLFNSTIANLAAATTGLVGPTGINWYGGDTDWEYAHKYSIGVQQAVGFGVVLDASYVANLGKQLAWTANLNPIPLGANFDSRYANPVVAGSALPDTLKRPAYPGWGDLTQRQFLGDSSYHSLQTTVNRRLSKGLLFGAGYTWSKSLGVTSFEPLVANNRVWNYGQLSNDRRHVLNINYSYQIPKLGARMNNNLLGVFTDNWTLSGITSYSSGSPFTPSFTTTPTVDISGTSSLSPRINVVGDGAFASSGNRMDRAYFNTAAFARPAVGTIGTAGVNILTQPGYTNWDTSVAKRFPIRDKAAFVIRAEATNVFNTSQISAVDTSAQYNASLAQIDSQFGRPTTTRRSRVMSFSARFEF